MTEIVDLVEDIMLYSKCCGMSEFQGELEDTEDLDKCVNTLFHTIGIDEFAVCSNGRIKYTKNIK